MPKILDLDELWEHRHGLAPQEVRVIPVISSGNFRARLLLTRSGSWPKHTDVSSETYVTLRGAVYYTTDHEFMVRGGSMVTFEPGEAHSARIEDGALSLNLDLQRDHSGD